MFDVLSFVSWITGKGADQTFQKICSMVIGLMNKLQDIGKIYRKTLAISAPSMEEYGTKLAPYSISCATKNVNLLPDPVESNYEAKNQQVLIQGGHFFQHSRWISIAALHRECAQPIRKRMC